MANLHDVWYMYLTVEDINKTKIKKKKFFFKNKRKSTSYILQTLKGET